ncbi:MAG: hypothetical protein ABIK43_06960, partial [candidate division WOR-3 bacterium]
MIARTTVSLLLILTSVNGGWQAVESITNRPDRIDLTCASNSRAVVCDQSDVIHVVWRGQVGDRFQVWYMCCPIDSLRWRDTVVLSSDTAPATDPCLALDSAGNLHVAWTSGESLRLATRERLSRLWVVHEPLPVFRGDSSLSIACDAAGTQHLVWLRGSGFSACICYVKHDIQGWQNHDSIGIAHSSTGLGRPSIAAAGNGDLMVVWKDQLTGPVVFARLRISGVWQEAEVVCESVGSRAPCAARSSDSLWHVVWAAEPRILWRSRSRAGWGRDTCVALFRNWEPATSVTADADGRLHLVWIGEP